MGRKTKASKAKQQEAGAVKPDISEQDQDVSDTDPSQLS